MRRIMILATLVVFAQAVAVFSQAALQTFPRGNSYRRIQVNAQTIKGLAPGKPYVVDLTQRGVMYEFDPSQIDFSRVVVRTAQGEVAIGAFLENRFLKDKLAGFKWTSQSFSIRTRSSGTFQTPPTRPSPPNNISKLISCNSEICTCVGEDSCDDMLQNTALCTDISFCRVDPISRQEVCSCQLSSRQ